MRTLPHDPRKLAAIYAGGVVGALIRVGLAEAASLSPGQWPWPTFAANLAGALLLGYFFALFRDHPAESLHHPFLGIGINRVGHQQVAIGSSVASAYPAPQLVELRQAEAVSIVHHHGVGVGDVEPRLHNHG